MGILVTGGSGLVGSHLLYELTRDGLKVRALTRSGAAPDSVNKVFEWYNPTSYSRQLKLIEWVNGDILTMPDLQDALQGIEFVYHCAAVVSFVPSERQQMLRTNIEGTANVVNACLSGGIKKLCHCSSIAALGRPDTGTWVDESHILNTSGRNSNYSYSKFGAEQEVWRGSAEGLPVVIVNPSVIIGPGDPYRSSTRLYQAVVKGLRFYSTGATGFVDVRDVVWAMKMLMDNNEICNERFILNSENLTYKEFFQIIAAAAGVKPPMVRAGALLSGIAWRLEAIRSFITAKKPLITEETARSANSSFSFSNKKVTDKLSLKFRSITDSAANVAAFYEKFVL